MGITHAISSGKKFVPAQITSGRGYLSAVEVIADGSNNASVTVFDSAIGVVDALIAGTTLAIGTTPTAVASTYFEYIINGVHYSKAAVAAGTAPGNDVVPQNKYGAVAFDIGANGTIDATEAADNATGYNTAALAVAAIPAVAADHVRMGYVTAIKTDGAFTFGTTELGAANSTVAYTSISASVKIIWEGTVPGASRYGGRNWTSPVLCENGILVSISGTNAAYIVERL